jgi:hypothetical protein
VTWLGRPHDRPHAAQAGVAGEPAGQAIHEAGQTLVQGAVRSRQILDVGRTGIAGADEREDGGSSRLRGGDERLQGIEAEQRICSEGVGAETGNGAPRGGRLPDQGLCIGRSGDRHIAALAIGDREQAGLTGRGADIGQRRPARRAEPLEAGELGLDRDAGRTCLPDQVAAMGDDRGGGALGRRP